MKNKIPVMAIISDDIRRDLHSPLELFKKIKVVHFYRKARYSDMKKSEFANTQKYGSYLDLFKKLKKLKPDIIQGPEPYGSRASFFNSQTVYFYSKLYRIPFVFPMFENRPAKVKFGLILGTFMMWYLKIYTNAAAIVINLNNGARHNLLEVGTPLDKIKRLNWGTWGVDSKEFNVKTPLRGGRQMSNVKNKIILFVGKVEEQKGILDLLEAFRIARKKFKNIQLQVIGSGSLVDKIKSEPGVKYLGIIKNQDISKYFQMAYITVTPSITTKIWEEQVGLVNIQSMACGTPVISTKSGAIAEYMPDKIAGLLVPEHNPKKLSEAIEKLLNNQKLRDKLGRQAHQYVLDHYEIRNNIRKAEELVLEILQNDKQPHKNN